MTIDNLEPLVRSWLNDTADTPYGIEQGVSRLMARLPETSQRGRWWRLPFSRRAPVPTSTIGSADHNGSPVSTVNETTRAIHWRVQPQIGASKFAVGVIAVLFGGILLATAMTSPDARPAIVPAASSSAVSTASADAVTGVVGAEAMFELKDDVPADEAERLMALVAALPGTVTVDYASKAEALAEFQGSRASSGDVTSAGFANSDQFRARLSVGLTDMHGAGAVFDLLEGEGVVVASGMAYVVGEDDDLLGKVVRGLGDFLADFVR